MFTAQGLVPRDAEAVRRVATMLRYWGARGFLHSADWEPHASGPQAFGVYASRWPLGSAGTLWTVVNRAGANLSGAQLVVGKGACSGADQSRFLYDCYRGEELSASSGAASSVRIPFRPIPTSSSDSGAVD